MNESRGNSTGIAIGVAMIVVLNSRVDPPRSFDLSDEYGPQPYFWATHIPVADAVARMNIPVAVMPNTTKKRPISTMAEDEEFGSLGEGLVVGERVGTKVTV